MSIRILSAQAFPLRLMVLKIVDSVYEFSYLIDTGERAAELEAHRAKAASVKSQLEQLLPSIAALEDLPLNRPIPLDSTCL